MMRSHELGFCFLTYFFSLVCNIWRICLTCFHNCCYKSEFGFVILLLFFFNLVYQTYIIYVLWKQKWKQWLKKDIEQVLKCLWKQDANTEPIHVSPKEYLRIWKIVCEIYPVSRIRSLVQSLCTMSPWLVLIDCH